MAYLGGGATANQNEHSAATQDLAAAMAGIAVHDHLCLIYESREEQFATVVPFISGGLAAGQRCLYVADDNTVEYVRAALHDAGIDDSEAVARGALGVLTKRDAYLRNGTFDPDEMIAFLAAAVAAALEDGFSALRVTGEMTWVLGGEPGTDRLLEYEAKLNYFFPGVQALAICQYNRSRFAPQVLTDVVRTHPLVIAGRTVCRNFHYVPPDELLQAGGADRELDRLLGTLLQVQQTHEALEQASRDWSATFDALKDMVCLLAADGTVLRCNRAMTVFLGLPSDQVAGRKCYDLMHGARTFFAECPYRRMQRSGRRETVELPLGDRRYQVTVDPLFGDGGAIVGAVHAVQDITEAARAQAAVAEKSRWLEAVNGLAVELAAAPADADIGAVLSTRLREATDAAAVSFGPYDQETQTIGPMYLDCAPGVLSLMSTAARHRLMAARTPVDDGLYSTIVETVVATLPTLTEASAGVVPPSVGTLLQRATGVDRFIALAFVAENELYGSSLLAFRADTPDPPRDLLEAFAYMAALEMRRRQAEAHLRASEARARFWAGVVDNAGEAIGIGYPDGRLREPNKAWFDLLGYTREELTQTDWAADLTPPEWLDAERAALAQLERSGRPVRYEKEYIRKDGSRVPIELLTHLSTDADGAPCYIGFVTDISERKRAKAEILRLNEDLERRVRERTRELDAANRELHGIVYSVSHDLRTPLRAVDGFSQTVLEDHGEALGRQGRSDLQRVRAAAQRMGELIDALLSLTRISRQDVELSAVDLSALARRLVDELRRAQPERVVDVSIEEGLVCRTDEDLAEIVLANLLANAWKFTARCEAAHISFGAESQDGERVYFVRDDGAGFDPSYAGKLFVPFERLHSEDEFPGLGAGLATVARVLARLGGRWWATGEPDVGATFYFTLPEPDAAAREQAGGVA
jgi:PAS domain S-box-containing protein